MCPRIGFRTFLASLLLAANVRGTSSIYSDEEWSSWPNCGSSRENPSEVYVSHYRPLFCPRHSPYTRSDVSSRPRPLTSHRPAHHFTSTSVEPASASFGASSSSANVGSSCSRCPHSHSLELSRAPTCERAGLRRGAASGAHASEVAGPEAERVRDQTRCFPKMPRDETVHSFQLTDGQGKIRRLKGKRYKGKVLLIVVMATFHALSPQIWGLQRLQQKYEGRLKILALPTNQFRVTENGANYTEVMNIMHYVRPGQGFVPAFDVYPPCAVNGADELPLFTHLKAACPATRTGYWEPLTDLKYDPVRDSDVRDAYEKFLVSGRGVAVARYDARVAPERLDAAIAEQIEKTDLAQ